MDFDITESQKIMKKAARNFLATECPKTLVREMELDERGYSPQLQRKMADLGWFGLVFPEEYGGSGGDFIDLMVLFEEMGRALLPGPFFATVVLGGQLIQESGSDRQKQRFLPDIVKGELNLTLALAEPASHYKHDAIGVTAVKENDEYIVNGTKLFVPYAHVADFIICAAKTEVGAPVGEGISLFIVDKNTPGITCEVMETIAMDKLCEVAFENTRVPEECILGELNQGWFYLETLLQKATVASSAEMIGGMEQVLEMTVDYVKQRVLFGRPIGSFQLIQSRCVEMLALLDESRQLTHEAGWKLSQGLPCTGEVSMAKAQASEAYQKITTIGHGVHGGVAYCLDHDMYLYFRRAKAAEISYGDADYHREKIAVELGL